MINEDRIAKLKLEGSGAIVIKTVAEVGEDGATRETVLKSMDAPHGDLISALDGLLPFVRDLFEVDDSWLKDRLQVIGVTWSLSSDEVEGAVVTVRGTLKAADAQLVASTPHLPFDSDSRSARCWSDAAIDALTVAKAEVRLFLKGKRAQADLFEGAAA